MSRIGRKPVDVPDKVKIELVDQLLKVTGPLGNLQERIPDGVTVAIDDKVVNIGAPKRNRQNRGYQGLVRALLQNMVVGVTKGYEQKLEIHGVGYKAEVKGNDGLLLSLGFSHQIDYKLPKGVTAEIEKNTLVTIKGIDKQAVGQVAAQIRGYRGPEPYKGKGVRYFGEQIRRKVGKAGAK